MCSRSELEAFIIRGVRELRDLEAHLNRRWARLSVASAEARHRFFQSLIELEARVEQMERLTATLDAQPVRTPRAAA